MHIGITAVGQVLNESWWQIFCCVGLKQYARELAETLSKHTLVKLFLRGGLEKSRTTLQIIAQGPLFLVWGKGGKYSQKFQIQED